MSQVNSRQSFIIGALSGALVLSIAAAGFFYLQGTNKETPNLNSPPVQETAAIKEVAMLEPPSTQSGLADLFGASDPSGKVKNVLRFDGDASNTLTSIFIGKELKIGDEDIYVKFYKTQQLDESGNPVVSHATPVLLSAITYKKEAGQWQVLSKQKNIGSAGSWGDAAVGNIDTLKLSPNATALMLDGGYGGQGVFYEHKELIAYSGNKWKTVGVIVTGGDNSGDCSEQHKPNEHDSLGPCWKYTGVISVVQGSKSDFPDLLVTRAGTQSKEHRTSVQPAKNVTYVFNGSEYKSPEHEL